MEIEHTAQAVFFGIIALVMCVAAVRVVTSRNIIHAALALVIVLAGVAGQFVLLVAEFAALTQVLVYIGAIVVLFLFGIMLTKAPLGDSLDRVDPKQAAVGGVVAVGLFGLMGYALVDTWEDDNIDVAAAVDIDRTVVEVVETGSEAEADAARSSQVEIVPFDEFVETVSDLDKPSHRATLAQLELASVEAGVGGDAPTLSSSQASVVVQYSNTKTVADSIFSEYIIAFEAMSLLLLAALIGAVCLARRN